MAKLFFVLGLIACSVAFAFKSHSLPVQARASVSRRGVASLKAVVGVDDKEEVREYFNTNGFERWNKIYSDSDEVNKVQLDIRTGHQQTIDKVLNWISQDGDASKRTFCDCGCGTGALAIPLVEQGAKKVDASDISSSMADEAARRAKAQLGPLAKKVSFSAADLESVSGKYDTVTCIDVMIHYPTPKMYEIVNHLGSLSTDKLILSFAPDTWYYSLLKKVGELFPGPSKTTRAYLHPEADVRKALQQAGFKIQREEMTGTNFYFSRLLEAVRE
mmetsp:Transcript_12027/g.16690  ORF Transcript_12027/g.16690 Transcript_12027/m.16690 type:complete len:274 (+) Transcript_12027:67-888(+)